MERADWALEYGARVPLGLGVMGSILIRATRGQQTWQMDRAWGLKEGNSPSRRIELEMMCQDCLVPFPVWCSEGRPKSDFETRENTLAWYYALYGIHVGLTCPSWFLFIDLHLEPRSWFTCRLIIRRPIDNKNCFFVELSSQLVVTVTITMITPCTPLPQIPFSMLN